MNATTKNLVKGYIVNRLDEEKQCWMETLYAVAPDGSVKRSDEHKQSPDFAGKWKWHACNALPAEAEFCGNYLPV